MVNVRWCNYYTFTPPDGSIDKCSLHTRYSLLSAASEEADVCKERTFTVVDQQGEFVQSQGAVGRDAEQREELPGACNTKQANM